MKDSITLSINEMECNRTCGIVAYNIYNILENNVLFRFPGGWLPGENIERCSWNYFVGCAFMIRLNLYVENLIPSDYFICFNEIPISRYILDSGKIILYNKNIKAYHQGQSLSRVNPVKEYYHYRNSLNFVLWNLKFPSNLYSIKSFFNSVLLSFLSSFFNL